jgi:hypothetical protein
MALQRGQWHSEHARRVRQIACVTVTRPSPNADDREAAAAEHGSTWRADIESFASREAIAACVVPSRRELPYAVPADGVAPYVAFVDPAGGSGTDSFTVAVAHAVQRADALVAVIDVVRKTRPPFSPEAVVTAYTALLHTFDVITVIGDRYAGEWPREQFSKHGVT